MRLSFRYSIGLLICLMVLCAIEARPTKKGKKGSKKKKPTRTGQIDQSGVSNPNGGDTGNDNNGPMEGMLEDRSRLLKPSRGDRTSKGGMTMHQKRMKARKYMNQYGYMRGMATGSDEEEKKMIKEMQMFMGMKATGELDDKTVEMMDRPRCGVADPIEMLSEEQVNGSVPVPESYVITGIKWNKNDLTYRFLNYPPSEEMTFYEVRDAIERAFKVWSDVTPLTFTESYGYADMYLQFGSYNHGDPYPFDGPGGTLAHAFLPSVGMYELDGDVHFDDSEIFDFAGASGTFNLFQVAAHEIGHGLGLSHSLDPSALMAPFYPGYIPNFHLPYDDVLGITALYGGPPLEPPTTKPTENEPIETTTQSTTSVTTEAPPTTKAPPTTTEGMSSVQSTTNEAPPKTTKPTNEETQTYSPAIPGCDIEFDATVYYRGDIFFFKGDRYWRMRDYQLLEADQPANLFFRDFPGDIDAAYESLHTRRFYVFKGNSYYVYLNNDQESGPHPITDIDPRLPSDIDAILGWQNYGKTYFFKDNLVWRLDEKTRTVDQYWPADISLVWKGVPHDITAGFHDEMESYTYFFKGSSYYRYDDYTYKVDKGYPRPSIQQDYFGCIGV